MKRILKKRIVPLLCAGLLLCTPHTIVYAAAGGMAEESTAAQIGETAPLVEETAPSVEETVPPIEETAPPVKETVPPTEEAAPPVETPPLEEATPPEVITPPTEATPSEAAPTDELPTENTEPAGYSVQIAWESLEFEYAPLWNPDEHCYDGWESTETPITVTNMSENGAPIRVTLTFVPTEEMGTAAVFSPCEDDLHSDEFTFSDGQVTFLLPRDADGETQTTMNLSLTGDPTDWEIQQYNQIGSIKMEIMPLDGEVQDLEVVPPPGVSDIPIPPATDLPLPETEPEQPPPSAEEQTHPETEAEKPKQESTPDVPPLPEHNAKEESQAAPSTKSGAPPQEEPQ